VNKRKSEKERGSKGEYVEEGEQNHWRRNTIKGRRWGRMRKGRGEGTISALLENLESACWPSFTRYGVARQS
jgi:hypothetical protein